MDALADSSPQTLVPFCRQLHLQEFCPGTRPSSHGSVNPRRTLWRWSRPLAPAQRPRTTRRQLRATPRQATTPGRPSLRALTRVPSCAIRARRVLPTMPAGPSGSAFLLKTGSVLLVGPNEVEVRAIKDLEGFAGVVP